MSTCRRLILTPFALLFYFGAVVFLQNSNFCPIHIISIFLEGAVIYLQNADFGPFELPLLCWGVYLQNADCGLFELPLLCGGLSTCRMMILAPFGFPLFCVGDGVVSSKNADFCSIRIAAILLGRRGCLSCLSFPAISCMQVITL